MAKSVYEILTEKFIEQLEKGVVPWQRPWNTSTTLAYSGATGKPYSVINQLLIDRPGWYYSKKDIEKRGLSIPLIDGADGKKHYLDGYMVFMSFLKKKKEKETDEQFKERCRNGKWQYRYFYVWHENDIPGMPKHEIDVPKMKIDSDYEADMLMSDYVTHEGIALKYIQQNQAYYAPKTDSVVLPIREQFNVTGEFYSTAFHELIHSTGHASRLNRIKDVAKFGSEEYSKEELIAEIGAAAILQSLGIDTESTFNNSAAYIESWLQQLKNDKRMIAIAAAQSEKAVQFIMNCRAESEV